MCVQGTGCGTRSLGLKDRKSPPSGQSGSRIWTEPPQVARRSSMFWDQKNKADAIRVKLWMSSA